MTDLDLLLIGCAVTFIAAGGAYLYIRERFEDRFPKEHEGSSDAGDKKAA